MANIRLVLWRFLSNLYPKFLCRVYGMHIDEGCRIAWSAHLDKSINPKGIHIGKGTSVLREAMILAHDNCRSIKTDTIIGEHCVVGVRSIILPGITIGNQVVIGGGSIVTKNVPANCVVVGNPARIIRTGVSVNNGKIIDNGQLVKN